VRRSSVSNCTWGTEAVGPGALSTLACIEAILLFLWTVLLWYATSGKLITSYYDCTSERNLGPLAPLFDTGPCEVLIMPSMVLWCHALEI
jgi:hypothetical protein